jgi:hypothetical protein
MAASNDKKTVVERAEALSEEVLESVRDRQQSVIEAMRKLVYHLDDAMPNLVDDPLLRKKVLDAIGDYYEQLARTMNEFVGRMVRTASGTLKATSARPAVKATAKKAAAKGTTAKKAAAKATAAKRAAADGSTSPAGGAGSGRTTRPGSSR